MPGLLRVLDFEQGSLQESPQCSTGMGMTYVNKFGFLHVCFDVWVGVCVCVHVHMLMCNCVCLCCARVRGVNFFNFSHLHALFFSLHIELLCFSVSMGVDENSAP